MGMIRRSAMPLLTTLAALVIIVHCVEEDLETEYRHDLRPRILDTGTPSYDQPWRAIEEDPGIQARRTDWEEHSPDEPPKRRRPGRKRKRRPQTLPEADLLPQERFTYPNESPRPYYDVELEHSHHSTELPRRQRRPESRPIRWTDDVTANERPLRRKSGGRRKRPSLHGWPEFSEFRDYPRVNNEEEIITTEVPYRKDDHVKSPQEEILDQVFNSDEFKESKLKDTKLEEAHIMETLKGETGGQTHVNYDKSLSEFSPELITGETANLPKKDHKIKSERQKATDFFKEYNKETANSAMDPLTLKDILKRSNGTSLSEILQQHNLSLTDLLDGKAHAVSIFKAQESLESPQNNMSTIRNYFSEQKERSDIKEELKEQILVSSDTKYPIESAIESVTISEEVQTDKENKEVEAVSTTTVQPVEEKVRKITTRRRYPLNLRKKLRMRPMLNVTNTYKGQLSRDLIALNARKYSRRNTTKLREWKDVILNMEPNNANNDNNQTTVYEITTIANIREETTMPTELESNDSAVVETRPQVDIDTHLDDINMDITESTAAVSIIEVSTEIPKNVTEKSIAVVTMARPTAISSGLRRQALNNRLKRKRLKHKNSTTEPPQDDLIKHLFGMGNLVSSSEFIARTQEPKTTESAKGEINDLDDFITTESTIRTEGPLHVKIVTTKLTTPRTIVKNTTPETAKKEIEEIFNDTQTSAKLSRILKERNMTLSELVEHRERGSSHVHLADIFHNASREPNPPEPFLSKSLLEPISKETYPLRALLEANLHDANGKVTTIEPSFINNANIPVVMDFRNNVNENAENMGIMSLFNNFTKNVTKSIPLPESRVTFEGNQTKSDTAPNVTNTNDTARESRTLGEIMDDVVSWNEIFSLMRQNNNESEDFSDNNQPFKKIRLDEDADGDGLIVLEDLQHLKEFDNNIASGSSEKIELSPYDKQEISQGGTGILDKIPSQTKSVTVATASIAGLAMILFLLTYAAFKWKQQRSAIRKKRSFCDERIPTPVFENRKGHKNNSSSRSISPMLQTSNIYTLNTLDSQNGKESPDYMWDSLRKPFQ